MNHRYPEIGDRVRIDRIPKQVDADRSRFPETRAIFEAAMGRTFQIRGFNTPGMIELWLHHDGSEDHSGGDETIWIERECVSLCESSE